MRSRSPISAWVVGLTITAAVATLGCGGGGGEDSGIQLNSVAFGDGVFVAVGDSDRAFANPGPGWTPFVTGVAGLDGIAWSQRLGTFVAVGDGGAIVTTVDGVSWVPQGSPTSFDLFGIAAGDAALIAVGAGGTILASLDGEAWVPRSSGTDATLYGVAFGGLGEVVAVGAGGTVVVSRDGGLTWQATFSGLTNDLRGVAYGSNGWVAVGQNGIILQGAEPTEWQLVGDGILPDLNGVAFLQGLYTVLGDSGRILTSADGIVYGESVSNTGQFLFGAAFGNGTFFVVGSGGRALSSVDGAIYQDGKV